MQKELSRSHFALLVTTLFSVATGCPADDSPGAEPDPYDVADLLEISPISGPTTEAGGQASFEIALAVQPNANVMFELESSDQTEGVLDSSSLTFTADNWNAPQQVTVTGVDDPEKDGEQTYEIRFAAVTAEDARFEGLEVPAVSVRNTDDETAGVTVSDVDGDTTEAGGQATLTVVLNSQPASAVDISVGSSNPNEGTVSPANLTFTRENWNAPQVVTVTGQDDAMADGPQTYEVVFGNTASDDPNYAELSIDPVEVSNVDDESAGFTVSIPSGDTTEAGGQATVTLVLNSEPTADVVVPMSTDAPDEAIADFESLTFTPENWNAPQTVTLTGQDDDLVDGNQPVLLEFGTAESSDSDYSGLELEPVEFRNVDDDSPGLTVSAIDGDTTESGGQATFEVVLNSKPFESVTLNFDSNQPDEGTLDKTSMTFTVDNWNAPQVVTVTGQDDELADGDQAYAVVFEPSNSDDAAYAGLTPQNVAITNVDNDSAGITVSAISGDTTEAGGQSAFDIVLNSEPFDDVTLSFDSNQLDEGTLDKTSVTFTAQNWNAPQTVTVTGQDDDLADGDQPYAVVFSATTSSDATYDGLMPANVAITNVDNDSAGITVSAISGDTTEAGGQASFDIVLNSEPFGDVTLTFDSNQLDEGTLDKTSVTFTAQNWNAPQTVTVTGQDDDLADGDQPFAIVFSATTSTDAAYAALTPANMAVTNVDDDSAGITVSAISGDTTEAGGQSSFSVVLNSEPYDDVTLSFDSNQLDEGTLDKTNVTFTAQNWNAPQTVTVTGQDDDLADGDQPYAVVFSATTSTDATYAALTPSNVAVTNVDDDSAGITVGAMSGDTTEAGGQASFDIVLNSEPFGDVTLTFDSNQLDEGTLNTTSVTFTAQNWNAPQTVTVTGQNDDVADGDQPYAVVFSAATSVDAAYEGLTPANVAATNVDDDSAGITVSAISGDTTEAGGQASFDLVLSSEPFGDVTLTFDSNQLDEGTLDKASVTFTAQNWNAPQTVTVTGQNDDLADGDQPFAVVFSAATSADAAYDGLTPSNVAVTNVDDDSAGITVGAISGDTTEAGGQASFTVVLNSEPFDDVTVDFDSSQLDEGTLDTLSVTFTAQNWDAPQTVTVTGQNDNLADGDQPYAVVFSAATSADTAYDGLTPSNVALTNVDDDSAGITVGAISGDTAESGRTATFTVVLNSEPFGDVTIPVASDDPTEGVTNSNSLTFTPSNWDSPQTVTVTGVSDALDDGDVAYNINVGPSSSTDPLYDGVILSDVSLVNIDKWLLFVDDDRGLSGETTWTDVLESNGIPYDFEAIASTGHPTSNLADYEVVIWSVGDRAYSNLTTQNVTALEAYLDAGGTLIYSGGHAVYSEPAADSFIQNYLGLTSYTNNMPTFSDTSAPAFADGRNNGPYGADVYTFNYWSGGEYGTMWSGFQAGLPTATGVLQHQSGNIVRHGGTTSDHIAVTNETATFRTLALGFDLNHVDAAQREALLLDSLSYLTAP